MENDEINENLDSPTETEEVDTESTGTDTEETDAPSEADVDVAKLQETNKRLFERAKKAEAEAKALKASQPKQQKPASQPAPKTEPPSSLSVEETVLRANGMSPELLKQLKAVAQVRGIGLIDAQADPIFVAVKEKLEKEQKQKEATLPASKGSGTSKPKKDVSTPGLSEAEHKRLVAEAMAGGK